MFRSIVTSNTELSVGAIDCLVVDSIGELMNFYQTATIVFVGKSITAKGGQNPIEPAALGIATIFGPNMQNFSDVARIFVTGRGAIQVQNARELESALTKLLHDSNRRTTLGAKAREVVHENQGALARTSDMIFRRLRGGLAA
jgi:3-deoxy-D-manno-octulosonic-acid transferase